MARRLGLLGFAQTILHTIGFEDKNAQYEECFENAMIDDLRVGENVWDIGANVGKYTSKFLDAVGGNGRVVAFEPIRCNYDRIRAAVGDRPNCKLLNIALGDVNGTAQIEVGPGEFPTTSRLTNGAGDDQANCVELATGDSVAQQHMGWHPHVMKIDVEGFELEVLRGMSQLLKNPELRTIFCEVHFGLLEERGMPLAPIEITSLLEQEGFCIHWIDRSHLKASRT